MTLSEAAALANPGGYSLVIAVAIAECAVALLAWVTAFLRGGLAHIAEKLTTLGLVLVLLLILPLLWVEWGPLHGACTLCWLALLVLALSDGLFYKAKDLSRGQHLAILSIATVLAGSSAAVLLKTAVIPSALEIPPELHATRCVRGGIPFGAAANGVNIPLVIFAEPSCGPCRIQYDNLVQILDRKPKGLRVLWRPYVGEGRRAKSSRLAAALVLCANRFGKAFLAIDVLFRRPHVLAEGPDSFAAKLGVDKPSTFMACVSAPETEAQIRQEAEDARALGVRVTPTVFVGRTRFAGLLGSSRLETMLNSTLTAVSHSLQTSSGNCAAAQASKPAVLPSAEGCMDREADMDERNRDE